MDRPQQTLGSITLRNAQLRPSSTAIIFENRTMTHREFAERSFKLMNALRTLAQEGLAELLVKLETGSKSQ